MKKEMQIPLLRFPEFKDEWKKYVLGQIARFSKGKGVSKSDVVETGITACIRYGELYTRYNEVITEVFSRTNADLRGLVLSEKNDVIIPASGETQIDIATASCVNESGIALGGDINIIKTSHNGVFLAYYLNSKKKIDIANLAQGISVVHLYPSQLSKLNLHLPTIDEQQKIASFLTVIEEKLDALKRKKSLLEKYKKGVMQQLFSQELRFRQEDGSDFPKWEKRKLGDVFFERQEKGNKEFQELLSVSISKGVHRQTDSSKPDSSSKDKSNYKTVRVGDIAYNSMRMWQGASGVSKFDGIVSPAYTVVVPKEGQNTEFFAYYFKTNSVIQIFQRNSQGLTSDTWNLKYHPFSSIKLNVPSYDEQTIIAGFLKALDKKSQFINDLTTQTETWKKGLLQKLFC